MTNTTWSTTWRTTLQVKITLWLLRAPAYILTALLLILVWYQTACAFRITTSPSLSISGELLNDEEKRTTHFTHNR